MSQKVTYHACPICNAHVANDITTYHEHLNKCGKDLFTAFPELKSKSFNTLWYRLTALIKEGKIIKNVDGTITYISANMTNKKDVLPPLTIQPPSNLPPLKILSPIAQGYNPNATYPLYNTSTNNNTNNTRSNATSIIDLEKDNSNSLDNYFPKLIQSRNSNYQYKYLTSNLIKTGDNKEDENKKRKRKILYGNSGDMKPPKRINIDPSISLDVFQHKVRQTRRIYQNVSYESFQNGVIDALYQSDSNPQDNGLEESERAIKKRKLSDDKEKLDIKNKKISVDNHNGLINARRALTRYLNHSGMLRKLFNENIYCQVIKRFFETYAKNYDITMNQCLDEADYWKDYVPENGEELDEWNEKFKHVWDVLSEKGFTEEVMNSLLEMELFDNLNDVKKGGEINQKSNDRMLENNRFWNEKNSLIEMEYTPEVFRGIASKTFVSL